MKQIAVVTRTHKNFKMWLQYELPKIENKCTFEFKNSEVIVTKDNIKRRYFLANDIVNILGVYIHHHITYCSQDFETNDYNKFYDILNEVNIRKR